MRRCKYCGKPLPEDAPGTVKYCPGTDHRVQFIIQQRENNRRTSAERDIQNNL